MAEVHRDVLRWDYFGVTDGGAMRARLAAAGRVPTGFADLRQYASVFRALLLEELRAHLQQVAPAAPMPGAGRRMNSAQGIWREGWKMSCCARTDSRYCLGIRDWG